MSSFLELLADIKAEETRTDVQTETPKKQPTDAATETTNTAESQDAETQKPQQLAIANDEQEAAAKHPILTNEITTEMLLVHQAHRGTVIRAVEASRRNGENIPPSLMNALEGLINNDDIAHIAAREHRSAEEKAGKPAPTDSTVLGQNISEVLRHSIAVTAVSSPSFHQNSSILSQTLNASRLSDDNNNNTSTDSVSPSRTNPNKKILERAYEARRVGDRRTEIDTLVDYLHRGQRGDVVIDNMSVCRVLRQIGDAHVALGEFNSAERFFFDWYLIADKMGADGSNSSNNKGENVRALTALGKVAQARGDHDAAHEWYSKAQAML